MAEQQVKILRSIGTAAGVLRAGAVVSCDEGTADSWVGLGLAERLEAKQEPKDYLETPEDDAAAFEVAVDGPEETKDAPAAEEAADEAPAKPTRGSKAKK